MVLQWFQQQPWVFYMGEGGDTHQLVYQRDACLTLHAEYLQQPLLLCSEQPPNESHLNKPYTYLACVYLLYEKIISGD
jgi:hypothetical protein